MRVRVRGRHAYRWPMLRAVVREQVQVQVQFWLVLGFCFCSPQPLGVGVWHMQEFWGGGTGAGLAVENGLVCCKMRRSCSYRARGKGGLHRSRFRFRFRMFGLLYAVVFLLFWLALGFCFCKRSGGDMHTCMLVLAGRVQEQVQVKASGGRRERFHSYGKMLYMHTQGLRWR